MGGAGSRALDYVKTIKIIHSIIIPRAIAKFIIQSGMMNETSVFH